MRVCAGYANRNEATANVDSENEKELMEAVAELTHDKTVIMIAHRLKKTFLRLMRIPGLYKKVPGIFATQTPKFFGISAGFEANEIRTTGGVWRIDMTRCPYHDECVRCGCPELCRCFCDSDDITYDGLHPKLVWHRTKTLGRGDDRCDFCMKIIK